MAFRPYEEYVAKIDGRTLPPPVTFDKAEKAASPTVIETKEEQKEEAAGDGWSDDEDWETPELIDGRPKDSSPAETGVDWSSKTDGEVQTEKAVEAKKKKNPTKKQKQQSPVESFVALTDSVLECKPRPYLILQALEDSYRPVIMMETEGVELVVYALECAWVWSQPNGKTNLSIPEAYLSKGKPKETKATVDDPADKKMLDELEEQKAEADGKVLADALSKGAAASTQCAD